MNRRLDSAQCRQMVFEWFITISVQPLIPYQSTEIDMMIRTSSLQHEELTFSNSVPSRAFKAKVLGVRNAIAKSGPSMVIEVWYQRPIQ